MVDITSIRIIAQYIHSPIFKRRPIYTRQNGNINLTSYGEPPTSGLVDLPVELVEVVVRHSFGGVLRNRDLRGFRGRGCRCSGQGFRIRILGFTVRCRVDENLEDDFKSAHLLSFAGIVAVVAVIAVVSVSRSRGRSPRRQHCRRTVESLLRDTAKERTLFCC